MPAAEHAESAPRPATEAGGQAANTAALEADLDAVEQVLGGTLVNDVAAQCRRLANWRNALVAFNMGSSNTGNPSPLGMSPSASVASISPRKVSEQPRT